jgi:hypothetical protein
VLAAVAQDGRALRWAAEALQQHATLRRVRHLSALEISKQRACLALALASGAACTLGTLSADIIEHVGFRVTQAAAVRGLVSRYAYYGGQACEPPPMKKHRRSYLDS